MLVIVTVSVAGTDVAVNVSVSARESGVTVGDIDDASTPQAIVADKKIVNKINR
jgi:hypothetical protein